MTNPTQYLLACMSMLWTLSVYADGDQPAVKFRVPTVATVSPSSIISDWNGRLDHLAAPVCLRFRDLGPNAESRLRGKLEELKVPVATGGCKVVVDVEGWISAGYFPVPWALPNTRIETFRKAASPEQLAFVGGLNKESYTASMGGQAIVSGALVKAGAGSILGALGEVVGAGLGTLSRNSTIDQGCKKPYRANGAMRTCEEVSQYAAIAVTFLDPTASKNRYQQVITRKAWNENLVLDQLINEAIDAAALAILKATQMPEAPAPVDLFGFGS